MNDGYAKHSSIEFSASFANTQHIAHLLAKKLQPMDNYNPVYLFLRWLTDQYVDHSVFPIAFADGKFEEMCSAFKQFDSRCKKQFTKESLKKIFPDNKDEVIDSLSTAFFKNQSTEVKYFVAGVNELTAAAMKISHLENKVLDMGAMISTYEEKVASLERQAINNSAAFEAVKNDKDAKIAELERIILELKLALTVPVIVNGDIVPCTPKEPEFDAKKSYEHLKALVTLQETRLQKLEKCQNCASPKSVDEAPPEKQDATTHKKHKPPVYGELELTIKDMICVARTEQPTGPSLTEQVRSHVANSKELIKQTHQKPDTGMELTGWRELSALAKHLNIDLSDIYVFLTSDGKVEIREHVMFPSKEYLDQIGNFPIPPTN